jgi:hypothetical protein
MSLADMLAGAEYDPMRVWVPWTVSIVRIALLSSWVALFGLLAATLAVVLRRTLANRLH